MESKIKFSFNLVPFGDIIYITKSFKHPGQEEEEEIPAFVEPLTTNIEKIEIHYEDGGTYSVPETTA